MTVNNTRRTITALFLSLSLSLALTSAPAHAARIGQLITTRVQIGGVWITKVNRVTQVFNFGHGPGKMWTFGKLISLSIDRHQGKAEAIATDPNGLLALDIMGEVDNTVPGLMTVVTDPHAVTISQAAFTDPDSILGGDVSFEAFGETFTVPDTVGIEQSFFDGITPAFNLDIGFGLMESASDPGFTGVTEGSSFVPVPEPASVVLLALGGLMLAGRRWQTW